MCTHILEANNQGNRNSLVSSNIAGWVIPIQKDEVSLPTSFNQQLPTLFFASFCTGKSGRTGRAVRSVFSSWGIQKILTISLKISKMMIRRFSIQKISWKAQFVRALSSPQDSPGSPGWWIAVDRPRPALDAPARSSIAFQNWVVLQTPRLALAGCEKHVG